MPLQEGVLNPSFFPILFPVVKFSIQTYYKTKHLQCQYYKCINKWKVLLSDNNAHEIADRLNKLADKLFEGNQAEMSRAMGMSPQGMNPYFNGERKPGFKIIKRLVELGVNATWVISGMEPMLISEIREAKFSELNVASEPDDKEYNHDKEEEKGGSNSESGNDFFSHINEADLSDTERFLLAEVKKFSDSLKSLSVPLQVKRLMLELMIEHIGQEIERLRDIDP